MQMPRDIIAALAFLAGGCAVSYLNYLISRMIIRKKPNILASSAVIRQIINIAYLAAVYFLTPMTEASLMYTIVGAVIGLTVPMLILTAKLVKEIDNVNKTNANNTDDTTKGGNS